MPMIREAGAIVVQGDGDSRRVLLVTAKENRRHWIFPKGHIESGESVEEAALREAREEAGVVGRVLAPAGSLEFTLGEDVVRVQHILVAHEADVPSVENRDLAWMKFDDALERLTFDDARSLLRDAWTKIPDRLGSTSSPSPR